MAFDLGNTIWTIFRDRRPLPGNRPQPVFLDGGTVNTSLGSDEIVGEGDSDQGQAEGALLTDARLFMSKGNDDFKGTGEEGVAGDPAPNGPKAPDGEDNLTTAAMGSNGLGGLNGSVGRFFLNGGFRNLPASLAGLSGTDGQTGGMGAMGEAGGDGVAGDDGNDGTDGAAGIKLENSKLDTGFGLFWDNDKIEGIGGKGGDGSDGADGGDGGKGGTGGTGGTGGRGGDPFGVFGLLGVVGDGGDGGTGGTGGTGGAAGDGGKGGNGGKGGTGIYVDKDSVIDTGFGRDEIIGVGGAGGLKGSGGLAGTPGAGGDGGAGGEGGDPGRDGIDGFTFFPGDPGETGADGATGATGATGTDGVDGDEGEQGYAIYNDGIIKTGAGNDLIDAMHGGFGGKHGKAYLGWGNDTVKGFGDAGFFHGGFGHDTWVLPGQASDYSFSGVFNITVTEIASGDSLTIRSFETIEYEIV